MTGLVGWWPLHENSGNKAYELSGNGNHGTLNGGVVQGVAGKGGLTSYSFDGSDDNINAGNILDGMGRISFGCWFNTNGNQPTSSRGGGLINKFQDYSGSADDSYVLSLKGSDELTGRIYNSSGNATGWNITQPFTDGWHHYFVTYDGSNITIYFDGEVIGTQKHSGAVQTNSNPLEFGVTRSDNGDVYYEGSMCDIRTYDRALSSEEVQELYNWGNGDYARPLDNQNSSSAVSRWAFDGDVNDSWGTNHGTKNGVSFVSDSIREQSGKFESANKDYVDLGGQTIPDGSSFTVSAWVKKNNANGTQHIYCDGGGRLSLEYDSENLGYEGNFYDGSDRYPINWNGPVGKWVHVTMTYNSSSNEFMLYGNGQLQDSTTSGSDPALAYNDSGIGANHSNDLYYWGGLIDDVRIYDKALSPSEVFELYRWGTKGRDMRKFTVNSRDI